MIKKIKFKNFKITSDHGAAMMLFAIFVFFVSTTIIAGISRPAVREFTITKNTFDSKQAYFLAESGAEDALYRIKNGMQIGASETLVLGSTTATTTITTLGNGDKQILTLGDADDHQRKVNMVLGQGLGAAFNYGMQVGTGGATITNSAGIIGNLYSNGPILGFNNAYVNGTAISANSSTTNVDQSFGSGTPASDNVFGNAFSTEDVAQSFKLNTTAYADSIQFYIKKVNSGNGLGVRIVSDQSGSPSTNVLTTGQEYNSPMTKIIPDTLTTNYQWVKIYFTTRAQLTAGTTYWIVLDAPNSQASNYFIIGGDTGYANGTAKIGSAMSQSWSQLGVNTDLFFSISTTTGTWGSIRGFASGASYVNDAYSHSMTAVKSNGTMKCKVGQLSAGNNKACDTSYDDPVAAPYPISDQDITDAKAVALAGGTSGSISLSGGATQSIGPKKIVGNVSVASGTTLNVTGTLWITGTLTVTGGVVQLDPSYGSNSGMIIVDGLTTISGTSNFLGSGTTDSSIAVVSTNVANPAITLSNSAGSVILMAPNGGVTVNNTAHANQITAKYLTLNNSATVTYLAGLVNTNFTSGPSGGWNLKSWKETQ
ncbi:MAG: hypothetical protein QG566_181 [Patescibacteria group bacterium]|nr:hypothetical protein [Patescibacteria group bacterium]